MLDPPRIVRALEFSPNFDMKRFDADMAYLRAKLNARKQDLFRKRAAAVVIPKNSANEEDTILKSAKDKVEGLTEIILQELKLALEDWETPLDWVSKKSTKLKDGRLIRIVTRIDIADHDFTPEIERPSVSRN